MQSDLSAFVDEMIAVAKKFKDEVGLTAVEAINAAFNCVNEINNRRCLADFENETRYELDQDPSVN